ncbi:MAG: hypothetical protein ACRBN8_22565 [Nannocystales bacterium]
MNWHDDYPFRRFAKLLWPVEFELAVQLEDNRHRQKGSKAASRIMAERQRGFRAALELAKLAKDVETLQAEMARRVS